MDDSDDLSSPAFPYSLADIQISAAEGDNRSSCELNPMLVDGVVIEPDSPIPPPPTSAPPIPSSEPPSLSTDREVSSLRGREANVKVPPNKPPRSAGKTSPHHSPPPPSSFSSPSSPMSETLSAPVSFASPSSPLGPPSFLRAATVPQSPDPPFFSGKLEPHPFHRAATGLDIPPPKAPPRSRERELHEPDHDEQSFANCLTHNFDVVSNQVGVGIVQTKSMTLLLKSIFDIQKDAATRILALIDKEQRKMYIHPEDELKETVVVGAKMLVAAVTRDPIINPKGKDQMERFSKYHDRTLEFLRREADQTLKDVASLEQTIIVPLVNHNLNNDGRLVALARAEKLCRGEMVEASKLVKRTHESCAKMIDEVIKAKAKDPTAPMGIEKTESSKRKTLLDRSITKIQKGQLFSPKKLQKKAYAGAEIYEVAVHQANARQVQFYSTDLPNLFNQLETLERARLHDVSKILTKLAEEQVVLLEPRQKSRALYLRESAELNPRQDMLDFIQHLIMYTGLPPPPVPFVYELPTPQDIAGGRFEHTSCYFRNTLGNIMKMQQTKFPEEKVPHVVEVCLKGLADLGGFKSEGIFRISIPKEELEALIKQFDQGDFSFRTNNPNVPAALLKQWLRMLEEPLIPISLYPQALALGQGTSINIPGASAFFKTLPPVNQEIIRRITLGGVAEVLQHQELNRMSVRNLAIVFSPAFLRNPSDDPMEMLNNAKYETQFTCSLFESILAGAT